MLPVRVRRYDAGRIGPVAEDVVESGSQRRAFAEIDRMAQQADFVVTLSPRRRCPQHEAALPSSTTTMRRTPRSISERTSSGNAGPGW